MAFVVRIGDAAGARQQTARTRRSSGSCPTTTSRDRRTPTTSSTTSSPRRVLIIDDDEAYSQGLVNVMIPILQEGRDQGRPPDDQRHRHRRDAGERDQVAGDLASDLERDGHDAAVADRRPTRSSSASTPSSRARRRSCSVPTAPTRRRSSTSRAATCRRSGLTSRRRAARSTKSIAGRRREVRPVRRLRRADVRGDRRRDEGDRVGLQVRPDAEPLQRAGGDQEDQHPGGGEPRSASRSRSPSNGNLVGNPGYLFQINSDGQVHRDPAQVID